MSHNNGLLPTHHSLAFHTHYIKHSVILVRQDAAYKNNALLDSVPLQVTLQLAQVKWPCRPQDCHGKYMAITNSLPSSILS